MLQCIETIQNGRWFKEPSPFSCSVQVNNPKLCIITGQNVSGKSLVRKCIQGVLARNKTECIHISQSGRCQSGIQRAFIYGDEQEDSTGYNSLKTIQTAIRTGISREKPFTLVLDEPEIGCSEELAAAIGIRIAEKYTEMPQLLGLFVITHSRELVRRLLPVQPTHWRLGTDNMELQDWCNRAIVPADLDEVCELGRSRWSIVNKLFNS